ncbi:MAG: hypothetical protein KQJ78_08860 [Deltaproteobacteria bacterium]|nr:hypothetical protein [Deltaproteobacteria bacterium]
MGESIPSIAQMATEVENLTIRARALGWAGREEDRPATSALPGSGSLLAQAWPGAATPRTDRPGAEDLEALLARASDEATRLEENIRRERRDLAAQGRLLLETEGRARRQVVEAEQALQAISQKLANPSLAAEPLWDGSRELRQQAARLSRWLGGLTALGEGRYRAASGRVVGWDKVKEAEARRRDALGQAAQAEAKARVAAAELERRRAALLARREALAGDLAAARRARQEARRDAGRLGEELRRRAARLARWAEDLAGLLGRADEIRELLARRARLLDQTRDRLTRLALPLDPPFSPALEKAVQAREAATALAARRPRLEELLARLGRRLGPQGDRALEGLKNLRRLNREIAKEEEALPGLVAGLEKGGAARAKAAAAISTLVARLEALAPQVAAADQDLETARRAFGSGLERARNLSEVWKEDQRQAAALRDQCEAHLAEAGLGLAEFAQHNEERRQAALPLCADGAPPRELAAPLACLAGQWAEAGRLAAAGETQAQETAAWLTAWDQAAPAGRPPLALKEFGSVQRRISGRRAHLERLAALQNAARYWREAGAGELARQLRQPAQEVAFRLSSSLASLARQERQTAGELAEERRAGQASREELGRVHELTSRQGARLERLGRDLASARRAWLDAQGDAQNWRTRAQDLDLRHTVMLQENQGLKESLSLNRRRVHGLRTKLVARHRAWREATTTLADLQARTAALDKSSGRWQAQAQGLKSKLVARHHQWREASTALAVLQERTGHLEESYGLWQERALGLRAKLVERHRQWREATTAVADLQEQAGLLAESSSLWQERALGLRAKLVERHRQWREAEAALAASREVATALARSADRWQERSLRLRAKLLERHRQWREAQGGLAASQILLEDLDRDLSLADRRSRGLRRKLVARHQAWRETQGQLAASQEVAQRLENNLTQLRQKALELGILSRTRGAALADTRAALDEARQENTRLAKSLAAAHRRSQALRAKALERHRLLTSLRRELSESQLREGRLQSALTQAEALQARQALEVAQARDLRAELAEARGEAARWEKLVGQLAIQMALAGQGHFREAEDLRAKIGELTDTAGRLREQAAALSLLAALGALPRLPEGGAPLPGWLGPEQVERLLTRLAEARRRLAKVGRSTLTQILVAVGLAGSLLMWSPGEPVTATPGKTTLLHLRPLPHEASQELLGGPGTRLDLRAQAEITPPPILEGKLEMRVLPLGEKGQPLTAPAQALVGRLAKHAGLTPASFLGAVRNMYPGQEAVEIAKLSQVSEITAALHQRHPGIFGDFRRSGTPMALKALTELKNAPHQAPSLFLDRLYSEYRRLGLSPKETLKALAANEKAAQNWRAAWSTPTVFQGRVKPLPELEGLEVKEFVERMSPFMVDRCSVFLRGRGDEVPDLSDYARGLAFDIHCAAKKFQVPVTLLLAIAHQETWFANVLGDSSLSASPFQIYRPTKFVILRTMADRGFQPPPKKIDLQEHLTLATYMAAYHLRELLEEAYLPATRHLPARVDSDRVMKAYNGSSKYSLAVAQRRAELAEFLTAN